MANETIDTIIDLNSPPENKPNPDRGLSQDDGLEVVVVDDTPPEDRNRAPKAPGTSTAVPDEDEIGAYTEGVQKRIRQMKWEYHEERRAKETAQREGSAAMDMAARIHAENQRLKKLLEDGHKTMLESNKTAAQSEMSALQESLKAAMEQGNTTLAAELQGKMAKAGARVVAAEQTTPIKFEPMTDGGDVPQFGTGQIPQSQPQLQQPPVQQRVSLSPKMQDWMAENRWFNQDRRMTSYAYGIHDELISQGIQPESDAYFKAINTELRQVFPEKFKNAADGAPPPRPIVGGANRIDQPNANPRRQNRRVELTQSELAVAKRLGITPQQYALEKQRLEQSNG